MDYRKVKEAYIFFENHFSLCIISIVWWLQLRQAVY